MAGNTEDKTSFSIDRRRVIGLVGSGAASVGFVGIAEGDRGERGRGDNGTKGRGANGEKRGENKGERGGGVGPCTCEECGDEYFCGKVDSAPVEGETYTFSEDGESYSVTIDSVTEKHGGEVTCFTFSSDDDIEKVCVKGGPDTATYEVAPEEKELCAPKNPGGKQPEISNFSFCGREGEDIEYFQVDLAGGDVSDPPFYGNLDDDDDQPDRLLEAFDVSSEGEISDPDDPSVFDDSYSDSKTVTVDGVECTFSWGTFDFDDREDRVTIDEVTLDATSDNDQCTVTLAGYELPEGDKEATRSNIDDQELIDYETKTLNVGETTALEIDL